MRLIKIFTVMLLCLFIYPAFAYSDDDDDVRTEIIIEPGFVEPFYGPGYFYGPEYYYDNGWDDEYYHHYHRNHRYHEYRDDRAYANEHGYHGAAHGYHEGAHHEHGHH
ncbi:MAG: hypothetical protein ACHQAX_05285 [Gammaproteobacteria bacterium]